MFGSDTEYAHYHKGVMGELILNLVRDPVDKAYTDDLVLFLASLAEDD